jgi:DNA-directed RNA polymerase subunit RPC12/RpoP
MRGQRGAMYFGSPSPEDFLRGAIPRDKPVSTVCPQCWTPFPLLWSPNVTGVCVCPYCNCRLLTKTALERDVDVT